MLQQPPVPSPSTPPRATCPTGTPSAAAPPLAPIPGALRSARRARKPAPDDAELLELGRQWQASAARERALDDELEAISDIKSPAHAAAFAAVLKEAEVGADLRRRIVQLRAKTWPGVLLKIALTTWAYDVEDAEFADILNEDTCVPGQALTMSLCRDLRAWFSKPSLDAALLELGDQFEAAWQSEVASWDAYQAAPRSDPKCEVLGRRWDDANNATNGIVDQIEKLPATTVAGLVVKTRACSWTHEGDPFDGDFFEGSCSMDHRLAAAVLHGLLKLDGRPLPTAPRASTEMEAA